MAPQALKIAKRDTNEYYYFSYRLPLGFDATLASTYTNRVNVHRYAGSGAVYTYFLQGLADGSSFTDPVNSITVTQVSHDVNTATVQVALTCTPGAPILSVSPSSQSSAPGASVNYTVSVTNKDSAACPQATLNLAATVPSNWMGTMTPHMLPLLPRGRSQPCSQRPPQWGLGREATVPKPKCLIIWWQRIQLRLV